MASLQRLLTYACLPRVNITSLRVRAVAPACHAATGPPPDQERPRFRLPHSSLAHASRKNTHGTFTLFCHAFAANCQTIPTVTMTSSPGETILGYRKLVAVASALEHWLQTLFLKVEAGKPAALLSEDFRSTEDRPVKWRGSLPVMECGVGSKSLPRFIAR